MSRKRILYILLVLGIALIGTGGWLLYDSTAGDDSAAGDNPEGNTAIISMPQGEPVIYEQVRHFMRGENYELYIYDSGGILYIEEKGLRFPSPERPATRTWYTGNLSVEQLNDLLAYLENSGLDALEGGYSFPEDPAEIGSTAISDTAFTVIVNSENLSKKVTASGYLTPDNGETYPDMPSPLDDIYEKLRAIALATEEVATENIEQG